MMIKLLFNSFLIWLFLWSTIFKIFSSSEKVQLPEITSYTQDNWRENGGNL